MTPGQAAAARVLEKLLSSDLPDLAARWLTVGLDTPALRELAGHSPGDAWGVDQLWRQALSQLQAGTSGASATSGAAAADAGEWLSAEEAWLTVVPVELARWRLGEVSAVQTSESLLRAGRDSAEVTALVGLDDLFWLEEWRFEPSADQERLDRERVALLNRLADDVILESPA